MCTFEWRISTAESKALRAPAEQRASSATPITHITLARDLEILIAGGYKLKSVTPVVQFLWSAHVEAVALLEKPKKRRLTL